MAVDQVILPTKEEVDALQGEVDALEAGANRGRAVFNGNGTSVTFAIEHLLEAVPGNVQVTPGSAAAARAFHVVPDEDQLTITFTSAPPSGTGNVVLYWACRL